MQTIGTRTALPDVRRTCALDFTFVI